MPVSTASPMRQNASPISLRTCRSRRCSIARPENSRPDRTRASGQPRARATHPAPALQIAPPLDRATGKPSAGLKTRVGLAKALLNAPDLLLLDEPTASLDPDTADWIRHKLKDYAESRGATLLLASHNMSEVERLADRVILLDQGRIIEDETPAALIATYGRETLEEV